MGKIRHLTALRWKRAPCKPLSAVCHVAHLRALQGEKGGKKGWRERAKMGEREGGRGDLVQMQIHCEWVGRARDYFSRRVDMGRCEGGNEHKFRALKWNLTPRPGLSLGGSPASESSQQLPCLGGLEDMNGGLWPLERQASEEDYPGLSLQKGKLRLKIRQEVSGQHWE